MSIRYKGNIITSAGGTAGGVPIGTIVMWSGAEGTIPTGWHICDGTNGTPDLRGRFVLGVGESSATGHTNHPLGSVGGEEKHTMTTDEIASHNHDISIGDVNDSSSKRFVYNQKASGTKYSGYALNDNLLTTVAAKQIFTFSVGSAAPFNEMPPYYTLYYIMKIAPDSTTAATMDIVND